ncbi:MAG: hypothetical protein PHF37_08005 [Phycisphaerae bacterium]|nr:hypothetical protein [Phycisphaerae bacterium]
MAKKIKMPPLTTLPPANNPFTDWATHLFTHERAQYIMVTNTASLYSFLMYGRGITDDNEFIKSTLNFMGDFLKSDGYEFIFRRLIAPNAGQISFSKTDNRKVTGSVNELIQEAKYLMTHRELSPFDVSIQINDTIMSIHFI